jgi:hypothetical protein
MKKNNRIYLERLKRRLNEFDILTKKFKQCTFDMKNYSDTSNMLDDLR